MLKAFATIRTIFLVFIVGYTVRGLPYWTVARTFDEQYARCAQAMTLLLRAAWIAIGWIAFETILGWLLATRRPKGAAAIPVPRGGEPPFAPPGHH
jgi:hypothetical protein